MKDLITNYIEKLTKEEIMNFLNKNNINLNEQELDFTFNYIKNNYKTIINDIDSFNIDRFKDKFREEIHVKLTNLINEYKNKYGNLLKSIK